jgi:sec-independent protein translocase protein TatA
MPFGISAWELLILLLVVLLVFGPKRLPEMGRSLGKGMREFKDSLSGHDGGGKDDDERPQIAASTASPEDETARATPERDTVSS